MKKYQHLTVKHENPEQLIVLLNKMKESRSKPFRFLINETNSYAKNIFMPTEKVACFKTDRKSMFESRVWIYISNAGLVVANITSHTNTHLGIINYNSILNSFFSAMIAPLLDEGFNCEITGEDISFSDILPEEVYCYLYSWQSSCNKSAPLAHSLDNEKWMNFIITYYKSCDKTITSGDLEQWLVEDCHWPQRLHDSIQEIAINLEYSLELLRLFDEYNNW